MRLILRDGVERSAFVVTIASPCSSSGGPSRSWHFAALHPGVDAGQTTQFARQCREFLGKTKRISEELLRFANPRSKNRIAKC
jgi:hypothetical protein